MKTKVSLALDPAVLQQVDKFAADNALSRSAAVTTILKGIDMSNRAAIMKGLESHTGDFLETAMKTAPSEFMRVRQAAGSHLLERAKIIASVKGTNPTDEMMDDDPMTKAVARLSQLSKESDLAAIQNAIRAMESSRG